MTEQGGNKPEKGKNSRGPASRESYGHAYNPGRLNLSCFSRSDGVSSCNGSCARGPRVARRGAVAKPPCVAHVAPAVLKPDVQDGRSG